MIKVRVGYRSDQYYVIPDEEAHVAYYLFAHQESRAVFSNGIAIRGEDIIGIEPAWNESLGWNPTHQLDGDDWNHIRGSGLEQKMRRRLETAKLVASKITPQDFRTPLPQLSSKLGISSGNRTYNTGSSMKELLAGKLSK